MVSKLITSSAIKWLWLLWVSAGHYDYCCYCCNVEEIAECICGRTGGLSEKMSRVLFWLQKHTYIKKDTQIMYVRGLCRRCMDTNVRTQTHRSDHSCQESSDKKCSSVFSIEKSPLMTNTDRLTLLPPQGRPLERYTLYCSRSHPLYTPPVCPPCIQIPPNTCLFFPPPTAKYPEYQCPFPSAGTNLFKVSCVKVNSGELGIEKLGPNKRRPHCAADILASHKQIMVDISHKLWSTAKCCFFVRSTHCKTQRSSK